jgi:hypothetical protein
MPKAKPHSKMLFPQVGIHPLEQQFQLLPRERQIRVMLKLVSPHFAQ